MCRHISAVALVLLPLAACGANVISIDAIPPPVPARLAQLWVDPGDERRDLYWGIGGRALAPHPDATYRLDERDDSGFSVSYDVVGPDGVEWSAKVGPEAQSEVVVSRILWGLGYHQPPIYYLPSWTCQDLQLERTRRVSEARFRPKLPRLDDRDQIWHWSDNPFLGATQFRGMLVVLLMLNSTDLKDANNSVYELTEPWDGAPRWFVVRDLGASLGETGKLFPRRNWLEGFERSGFITGVTNGTVQFDYEGRHQYLLSMIGPDDVRWAAARMSRLTDQQLHDAFRAGNYARPIADRFVRRIREKVAQGLALPEEEARDGGV